MKLEVGKKYELNNGEIVECTEMRGDDPEFVDSLGYGSFIVDGMCYHQDGRFAADDHTCSLSIKRCVDDDDDQDVIDRVLGAMVVEQDPYDDYATLAAKHGICITMQVGEMLVEYDGRV